MAKKNQSYNEAIAEIEEIINTIESGDLDVDELSEKVKRVSYLLKWCRQKLSKTAEETDNILKELEN